MDFGAKDGSENNEFATICLSDGEVRANEKSDSERFEHKAATS